MLGIGQRNPFFRRLLACRFHSPRIARSYDAFRHTGFFGGKLPLLQHGITTHLEQKVHRRDRNGTCLQTSPARDTGKGFVPKDGLVVQHAIILSHRCTPHLRHDLPGRKRNSYRRHGTNAFAPPAFGTGKGGKQPSARKVRRLTGSHPLRRRFRNGGAPLQYVQFAGYFRHVIGGKGLPPAEDGQIHRRQEYVQVLGKGDVQSENEQDAVMPPRSLLPACVHGQQRSSRGDLQAQHGKTVPALGGGKAPVTRDGTNAAGKQPCCGGDSRRSQGCIARRKDTVSLSLRTQRIPQCIHTHPQERKHQHRVKHCRPTFLEKSPQVRPAAIPERRTRMRRRRFLSAAASAKDAPRTPKDGRRDHPGEKHVQPKGNACHFSKNITGWYYRAATAWPLPRKTRREKSLFGCAGTKTNCPE